MRMALRALMTVAALLLGVSLAAAGGRVALVIGNSAYTGAPPLENAVPDAQDIAAELRRVGFTVIAGYDLGKRQTEERIGAFSDRLAGAEAGLFYYAGHGISVAGRNFLVPSDAHLDAPAKLKFESIAIDDIAEMMRQQAQVNVLILDACRNNPFARGTGVAVRGAAEAAPGLATASSYAGAYTVYSAQEGAVALDGSGRNSPFAAALLKHLATPGAPVETVMGMVKAEVEDVTRGFQSPDAKGLLVRSFSLVPQTAAATRATGDAEGSTATPEAEIERLVTGVYLRPDPDDIAGTVRGLFTDPAVSFGRLYGHGALAEAKAKWFARYARWRLQMQPGSFKATFYDEATATVTFDMRYKYWPRDEAYSPIAGTAHVTLDLVKAESGWKIEMENSTVD